MRDAVVQQLPEIGVTRVSRWCFNCYLVEGDDGVVVVDPGWPAIADDLAPVIEARGLSVAAVVVTHAHPDHISGAPGVARRFDAPVLLNTTTLGYIDGVTRPRTPPLRDLARTWPVMIGQPFDARALAGFVRGSATAGFGTRRGMLWPGDARTGVLHDGQPLPGSAWTVIATPGHTDDHMCFWHADTGTMLSGDAVIGMRGHPRNAPDVVDRRSADMTRGKLRALDISRILPGHGLPMDEKAP